MASINQYIFFRQCLQILRSNNKEDRRNKTKTAKKSARRRKTRDNFLVRTIIICYSKNELIVTNYVL